MTGAIICNYTSINYSCVGISGCVLKSIHAIRSRNYPCYILSNAELTRYSIPPIVFENSPIC